MNSDSDKKKVPFAFPATKRANKSDLDVTPVMNLFMVMVPFLVSMAVFTQIAVIDFSLPPAANGESEAAEQTKELDISIVITETGFTIVGTGKKLDQVPRVQGSYQFEQLRVLLKAIKFQYPSQQSVIMVLDSDILYDDIIKFMDVCRESQFPDIGLSGAIG
jgi:biopolymer transport protein ExbD